MGKTADLTVDQKKIIDTLHTSFSEKASGLQSAVLRRIIGKLAGREKGGKDEEKVDSRTW